MKINSTRTANRRWTECGFIHFIMTKINCIQENLKYVNRAEAFFYHIFIEKKKLQNCFIQYSSTWNFGSRKSDVFSPHDNFTENQKHIPSFLLFRIYLFHHINYIFHVTNYEKKNFSTMIWKKSSCVSSFNVPRMINKYINRLVEKRKKRNFIFFSYGKQLGSLFPFDDFMLAVRLNKGK